METIGIVEIDSVIPYFFKHKNVWSSYDDEADVLYLHFKKPNLANNSEMTEDEIIVRYDNDEIVGLTILNASERVNK